MAKATFWTVTDVDTKVSGANRIRYPGSPHRKQWILGVGDIKSSVHAPNAVIIPPGSTAGEVETRMTSTHKAV